MQKYIDTLYTKKKVKRELNSEHNRKREAEKDISKYDIIKKHHKFLRDSDSQQQSSSQQQKHKQANKRLAKSNNQKIVSKSHSSSNLQSQSQQKTQQHLAKQYYESLFKQYAIVDLSKFQNGQIGCRWRTQKQVISSKGQRLCGALKCKQESTNVYEMNFGYYQDGYKKNALVKISVCKQCGIKLNYCKKLKQVMNSKVKKEQCSSDEEVRQKQQEKR